VLLQLPNDGVNDDTGVFLAVQDEKFPSSCGIRLTLAMHLLVTRVGLCFSIANCHSLNPGSEPQVLALIWQ
jgi:hypothetical protein